MNADFDSTEAPKPTNFPRVA